MLRLLAIALVLCACRPGPGDVPPAGASPPAEDSSAARAVLERHLGAVASGDLSTLRETLSPELGMTLLLPGAEPSVSVDGFVAFHEAWFADTSAWTWTPRVDAFAAGADFALATVEATYREPERDGVPYANRMQITYALRKSGGDWYVVRDHASSTEKSTD